jgi:hypothetical protein
MRLLILDDNKTRHTQFARKFFNHELMHVRKYSEVVSALQSKGPWDVVFLDHDLADFGDGEYRHEASMYGSSRHEYTGVDVACFISRQLSEEKRPPRIVVHSWNPDGARTMAGILQQVGIHVMLAPSCWMEKSSWSVSLLVGDPKSSF